MVESRADLLSRFNNFRNSGIPIIGGGAGVGISAKAQVAGGIDFLVVYNSGRFRMAGLGSLAGLLSYGNANQVMLELVDEIISVSDETPVIAGVCGTDPTMSMDWILEKVKEKGCAGVQNFPTVGLCDGIFRKSLEETGMAFSLEVDMIAKANGKGLLTICYVFNPEEARLMAVAGADIIVVHFGLTLGGTIGSQTTVKLEDCIEVFDQCAVAANNINSDVIILCHGGPVAMAADAEFIIQNANHCHGFLGASSMERLPTEIAIARTAKEFKDIKTTAQKVIS
jgi:predicted TIM-barrel enzyme